VSIDITGYSSSQIATLSSTSIAGLTTTQIASLTTSQIIGLKASQISAMSTAQIKSLSASQISALTTSAITGLSSVDIAALSTAQLAGLTSAQISSLSTSAVSGLSTTDIAALTTSQISGLTSAQLAKFTTTQVAKLSATQLGSIQISAISGLSAADLGVLTPSAISGLTSTEIAALSTAQLTGLTSTQISNLSTSAIAGLSTTDIAALTTSQISGLTAAEVGSLNAQQFAKLNSTQIGKLSTSAISGLTTSEIASLTTSQLSGLTSTQIGNLSTSAITGLSTTNIGALTTSQISGLTAAEVGSLSSQQFATLTSTQISALSTSAITGLTTSEVASLTATQFSGLTSTQLGSLTSTAIGSLTTTELNAMSGAQIAGLSSSQLQALKPNQYSNIHLNYNSILNMMNADAVVGMTASKFNALTQFASTLNTAQGVTVSSYLQNIIDSFVLGSAANAYWTGGATSSVTLGNLSANSTQTQVNELIGKWFLGTDLPSSSVKMSGAPKFTVTYSTVSSPVFSGSGPLMSDVNQGYLGDCFLLAPLAELACKNPTYIRSMITDNGNNTYGVRFYVNGQTDYVTVNNQLADGGTEFNYGPNIWASLIEQAYTELQASGIVIGASAKQGNSYSTIGNGGFPECTLEELTGAATITDFTGYYNLVTPSASYWTSYVYNGSSLTNNNINSVATTSGYNYTSTNLQNMLITDLNLGYDLILSSNTDATDSNGKSTLISDHAMAIYGYDSITSMFEIYNPWGTMSSGQYWDTTFEVSLNTLLSAGDTITVDSPAPAPPVSAVKPTLSHPSGSISHMANQFISASAGLNALSSSASAFTGASQPQTPDWSLVASHV
jgi:Calpain family cysteine protease/ALTTAQ repeat